MFFWTPEKYDLVVVKNYIFKRSIWMEILIQLRRFGRQENRRYRDVDDYYLHYSFGGNVQINRILSKNLREADRGYFQRDRIFDHRSDRRSWNRSYRYPGCSDHRRMCHWDFGSGGVRCKSSNNWNHSNHKV